MTVQSYQIPHESQGIHNKTIQIPQRPTSPTPHLLAVASLAIVTESKDMKASRPILTVYQKRN